MNMLCSLGCGQEAISFSKDGSRGWCDISFNKCPAKREKDSKRKKGIDPFKKKGIPHPKGAKGKTPWNYGKKTSEETKKKISDSLHGKCSGISCTPELENLRRKKISDTMRKNPNSGGYRQGSGRSKAGYYRGIWCDSSWELAWVLFHLENEIPFTRCKDKFPYIFEEKIKNYTPDFILSDGTFIEIKGYITEQVKSKIEQFPHKIQILFEKDMKIYLDFAINKYGKDFINLYEA